MQYKKGTITFAKETVFYDNGEYDITGHPAMIPVANDEDSGETYYLLLTSNIGRINIYPDMYYDLSDYWEEVGLEKPSLINLQSIYKSNEDMVIKGGLMPRLYKDVIASLKTYQEKDPSLHYNEIKNRL